MLKRVAKTTGVFGAIFCIDACAAETETPLGSQNGLSAAQRGSVVCGTVSGGGVQAASGGGHQLVDPAGMCVGSFSGCSDEKVYEVHCDGLECVCLVDGLPGGSGVKTHCPHIEEAALMCDWPIRLPKTAAYGFGPIAGARCETEGQSDSGCECDDKRWVCPGIGGCNVLGAHVPVASTLPVLRFLSDNTFTVAEGSDAATLDQLTEREAPGFYGTWVLQGDVLSLRSNHSSGDATTCSEQPGRYTASFDQDCNLTELSLLDDPCVARHLLATQLAPLE